MSARSGGVPPPPGRLVTPAAPDYLARPIGDVCTNLPGVLPMRCYMPAKGRVPSGDDLLHQGTTPPPVTQAMTEKLLSALASIRNGDMRAARRVTDGVTIRQFRTMLELQQMQVIDRIWNTVTTSHPFTQAALGMADPLTDSLSGLDPLPSSVCPVRPGMSVYQKRLNGRQPFREFSVGFRVDGSDGADVSRITGGGMTQQRLSTGFMLTRRGLQLAGTVMMDQTQARVWTGNYDIFNETAVCVSRNFFGASAFPERGTESLVYVWAVNCSNLVGFDTEAYQVGLTAQGLKPKQWRPGEKAFEFIPAANVLGYVQIDKRGAPAAGGWSFDVPANANWTWTGAPTVKQRAYIEDELAAWRGGSYTIPPEYDFANS